VIPGEWLLSEQPIEINAGRCRLSVSVRNIGDRPIQVGSHFHFFEANRALDFDRPRTLGMRLDVPSGQSIRFEAGDERDVDLVDIGGTRRVIGFNNLVNGSVDVLSTVTHAMREAADLGFAGMHDWQRYTLDDGGTRPSAADGEGSHP
jgi:urease subunit beta/urease subunit gamma/beta